MASSLPNIPTQEPKSVSAGESWVWNKTPGSPFTPAGGWALNYYFRGIGTLDFVAAADPTGTFWNIVIPAATTAALAAGGYQWVAQVVKGAETYTIDSGVLVVLPNLQASVAGALQTHAEKVLATIEVALAARLMQGGDIDGYTILGRSVSKIKTTELYRLRKKYQWEVYRQRHPEQGIIPVEVHLSDPN